MASVGRNASWIALAQVFKVGFQFVGIAILTRLLPASDYGLIAMAQVVINFALLFRDMGTSAAIVQRETISDSEISTLFWINCAIGILIALCIYSLANPIAEYYGSAQLAAVLQALSATFPIVSVSLVHQALLERRSAFRTLSIVDVATSLIGLLVAVVAAIAGAGVYSLVLQSITTSITASIAIAMISGFAPRFTISVEHIQRIFGFSGNLFTFNFVNYFSRNADSLIIGRVLGPGSLGAYSIAYRILLFPLQNVSMIFSRALYPELSRKQNSRKEMGALYIKSLSMVVFLTAPITVGIFVMREPLVQLLFGDRWLDVAKLLFWMAPVGFIQSLTSTTGTVFMATGRTDILMGLGVVGAVLQVAAFLIGVQWGLEGVAACYLAANVLIAIPSLVITLNQVECSGLMLTVRTWKPFAMALLMGSGVYLIKDFSVFRGFGLLLETIANIIAGIVIYSALTLFFGRTQIHALSGLFR